MEMDISPARFSKTFLSHPPNRVYLVASRKTNINGPTRIDLIFYIFKSPPREQI
jgi:hypothetical protein